MSKVDTLHFWCHKILPLVYDDSLSYYELLCKVVAKMNELIVSNNELSDVIKKEITEQVKEAIDSGALEDALDDALKEIKNTVSAEETARKNADTTLQDNIDKEVSDRKSADSTLSQRVYNHSLKGKKVLLIGDSMAYGTGNIIDDEPRGWAYYFEQITGCNADIIGLRQAGFIATTPYSPYAGLNFEQSLNSFASKLTSDKRNEYEVVLCVGGWNDNTTNLANNYESTVSDLHTAVNSFCRTCKKLFPNANLFLTPINVAKAITNPYWDSWMWIIRGAEVNGVPTTTESLFWMCNRTDWVNEDGVHPNEIGYGFIGHMLASWVLGGQPTYGASNKNTYADGVESEPSGNTCRCVNDGITTRLYGGLKATEKWVTMGTNGTLLMTVAIDYRPAYTQYLPVYVFYKQGETTQELRSTGWIIVSPNGQIRLGHIVNETILGQIYQPKLYFSCSWMRGY